MITCAECKARLYPDDPTVKSGAYHLCGCNYCAKPSYYRELELSPPQVSEVIHRHSDMSKQEFALLRNLEGQVKYLQGKVTERQQRKPPAKPAGYKGIK